MDYEPSANETPQNENQRLHRGYRAYLADPPNRSTPDATGKRVVALFPHASGDKRLPGEWWLALATALIEHAGDGALAVRDRASAVADFLSKLQRGELLSRASTHELLALMEAQTVPRRLRLGLPDDVRLADKCGTSHTSDGVTATYNDIGVFSWPDGHSIVVAAFLTASPASRTERDALFAELARTMASTLRP